MAHLTQRPHDFTTKCLNNIWDGYRRCDARVCITLSTRHMVHSCGHLFHAACFTYNTHQPKPIHDDRVTTLECSACKEEVKTVTIGTNLRTAISECLNSAEFNEEGQIANIDAVFEDSRLSEFDQGSVALVKKMFVTASDRYRYLKEAAPKASETADGYARRVLLREDYQALSLAIFEHNICGWVDVEAAFSTVNFSHLDPKIVGFLEKKYFEEFPAHEKLLRKILRGHFDYFQNLIAKHLKDGMVDWETILLDIEFQMRCSLPDSSRLREHYETLIADAVSEDDLDEFSRLLGENANSFFEYLHGQNINEDGTVDWDAIFSDAELKRRIETNLKDQKQSLNLLLAKYKAYFRKSDKQRESSDPFEIAEELFTDEEMELFEQICADYTGEDCDSIPHSIKFHDRFFKISRDLNDILALDVNQLISDNRIKDLPGPKFHRILEKFKECQKVARTIREKGETAEECALRLLPENSSYYSTLQWLISTNRDSDGWIDVENVFAQMIFSPLLNELEVEELKNKYLGENPPKESFPHEIVYKVEEGEFDTDEEDTAERDGSRVAFPEFSAREIVYKVEEGEFDTDEEDMELDLRDKDGFDSMELDVTTPEDHQMPNMKKTSAPVYTASFSTALAVATTAFAIGYKLLEDAPNLDQERSMWQRTVSVFG